MSEDDNYQPCPKCKNQKNNQTCVEMGQALNICGKCGHIWNDNYNREKVQFT